jgi:BASS family bile acid:Na+ symporter
MQQLVSQVLLPVVLAAIMLGMGLGLRFQDFTRVVSRPKASLIGFLMQLLLLPALALIIILLLPLQPAAAAGLFLVSLCPGGATSNLFSFIARGDIALSVTLTGITSLLSPFILPLAFLGYLQFSGDALAQFSIPLIPAMKQLAIVTLVPVSLGMIIRHFAPAWSKSAQPIMKKVSTIAMIIIVIALMATNLHVVENMISMNAVAVLMLATVSITIAYAIAGFAGVNPRTQRTIAIEVGVQNAGTAMMVALAILHKPELAFVPLMYGLLMNIPAFAFVAWVQKKPVNETSPTLEHSS